MEEPDKYGGNRYYKLPYDLPSYYEGGRSWTYTSGSGSWNGQYVNVNDSQCVDCDSSYANYHGLQLTRNGYGLKACEGVVKWTFTINSNVLKTETNKIEVPAGFANQVWGIAYAGYRYHYTSADIYVSVPVMDSPELKLKLQP